LEEESVIFRRKEVIRRNWVRVVVIDFRSWVIVVRVRVVLFG
jgi:hypothetical protein